MTSLNAWTSSINVKLQFIPSYFKRSLVGLISIPTWKSNDKISTSDRDSLWARLHNSSPENLRIRVLKILSAIFHLQRPRCLAFLARPAAVSVHKPRLNYHFNIFQRNFPCIKEQGNPKRTKSKLNTVLEFNLTWAEWFTWDDTTWCQSLRLFRKCFIPNLSSLGVRPISDPLVIVRRFESKT